MRVSQSAAKLAITVDGDRSHALGLPTKLLQSKCDSLFTARTQKLSSLYRCDSTRRSLNPQLREQLAA